ncbi:MAG TPA: polysaccharide deacetylase family protein [Nitrospiria bacterium]|nr:polysaccharide deacetylase family protein [Nitrospiria bacterium]
MSIGTKVYSRTQGPRLHPIVTTSWDDGHPCDLQLSRLLSARKLKGTFYVPIRNSEGRRTMESDEIRTLARSHEIGGHTLNHLDLTSLSRAMARDEIVEGKRQLERLIGRSLKGFAFPRGRMNASIVSLVKEAGFKFSRTIYGFHFTLSDGFLIHPTLQAYPHNRMTYIRNAVRRGNFEGLGAYVFRLQLKSNWKELAKTAFDTAIRDGGVWHLWGHSWEIDELNLWGQIEELFDYISNRPGVLYLTNGEVSEQRRGIAMNNDPVADSRASTG